MAESPLPIKKIIKQFVTIAAGMVNLHFMTTKINLNIRNPQPEDDRCF